MTYELQVQSSQVVETKVSGIRTENEEQTLFVFGAIMEERSATR
jgi:hypothetical protein